MTSSFFQSQVCSLYMLLVYLCSPHVLAEPVSVYCDTVGPTSVWESGSDVGIFAVFGDIAYVGVRDENIHILDYSDPSDPRELSVIADTEDFAAYAGDGNTLITVDEDTGTRVFDVSEPAQPVEIASFEYFGYPLATRGEVMYVRVDHELRSYQYSGKDAGQLLGSIKFDSDPRAVLADQEIGFVLSGCCIYTLDFLNPAEPMLLNEGVVIPGGSTQLARYGDVLVTTTNGFTLHDVSDPLNPKPFYSEPGTISTRDIKVEGDNLYVADRWFGLHVFDISMPLNPSRIAIGNTDSGALNVQIGSDFALAKSGASLVAFADNDLSTAFIDLQDDIYETAGSAECEGIQFVAARDEGLFVYDLLHPEGITEIARLEPSGGVWSLLIDNDLLYAQTGSAFRVYDIHNPESPIQIGSYGLLDDSRILAKYGDELFVARGSRDDSELVILDVSDPNRPRRIATYFLDETILSVARYEGALFIAKQLEGVEIIDIRNPFSPTFVQFMPDEFMRSLDIVGGRLVTASDKLRVFELDDVFMPQKRSELPLDDLAFVELVEVRGSEILSIYQNVYTNNSGLLVLDVADPDAPAEITRYPLFDRIRGAHFVQQNIGFTFFNDGVGLLNANQACQPCRVDFNLDGEVNFFDVSRFIVAYSNMDPAADFNDDGQFSFFDVSEFLSQYGEGCP